MFKICLKTTYIWVAEPTAVEPKCSKIGNSSNKKSIPRANKAARAGAVVGERGNRV